MPEYRPEPTQTCKVCGDWQIVKPDGRGFPPDIAARKLAKRCKSAGHTCDPQYQAGVHPALAALLEKKKAPAPDTGA